MGFLGLTRCSLEIHYGIFQGSFGEFLKGLGFLRVLVRVPLGVHEAFIGVSSKSRALSDLIPVDFITNDHGSPLTIGFHWIFDCYSCQNSRLQSTSCL